MLNDLDLSGLQQRSEFNKLVSLFKVAVGMVPAINSCDYLAPPPPQKKKKNTNKKKTRKTRKNGFRLNNSSNLVDTRNIFKKDNPRLNGSECCINMSLQKEFSI